MTEFDWSPLENGKYPWLSSRTILLCRHGSHAYGTNIATSDEDFRGLAIAPREYYLGNLHKFEQEVCLTRDITVFEIKKFIGLAAVGNPNVLEVLFVDESDRIVVTTSGAQLLAARDLFLSRRLKFTFAGYARAQLRRMAGHNRWLTNPPQRQPTRADFNLPERTLIPQDQLLAAEAGIRQKLDSWSADFLDELERDMRLAILQKMTTHLAELGIASDEQLWKGAARTIGYDENFIELLDRERRYTARKREWDQYNEWKRKRNPARSALEAEHGYDTKHAMHLVRLMRMCREILTLGKVIVRRPDAEELLSIRAGSWSYERLVDWAEREDAALEEVAKTSPLPNSPDVHRIDALCSRLVAEAIL